MGRAMPELDAFSVDAAAGAEEVEMTRMLAGSDLKPGSGAGEAWKRDTPVAMPAGTGARGTPPKTGTVVTGTGPMPKFPKAGIPGRGAMTGGGTAGITGGAIVGGTRGVAGT